jgi:hypothetical protein
MRDYDDDPGYDDGVYSNRISGNKCRTCGRIGCEGGAACEMAAEQRADVDRVVPVTHTKDETHRFLWQILGDARKCKQNEALANGKCIPKKELCTSSRYKLSIELHQKRGQKMYISLVKKNGDTDWHVHELLGSPNLTKANAEKSAQKQFLYDNASRLKLEYPRKVKEEYKWEIIACGD